MAFVAALCKQCGAQLSVDDTHERGVCEHCGCEYITEKVIQNFYNTTNVTNKIEHAVFKTGDTFEDLLTKFDAYAKLGEWKNAESIVASMLKNFPHDARSYLYKSIILSRNYDAILESLKAIESELAEMVDSYRNKKKGLEYYSFKSQYEDACEKLEDDLPTLEPALNEFSTMINKVAILAPEMATQDGDTLYKRLQAKKQQMEKANAYFTKRFEMLQRDADKAQTSLSRKNDRGELKTTIIFGIIGVIVAAGVIGGGIALFNALSAFIFG